MLNIIYIYVYTHYYTFIYFGDYTPSLSLSFSPSLLRCPSGYYRGVFFVRAMGLRHPHLEILDRTSPNLVLPREYFSRSLCARGGGKAGKSRTKRKFQWENHL